jgi:hypothetical protein
MDKERGKHKLTRKNTFTTFKMYEDQIGRVVFSFKPKDVLDDET